MKDMVNDEVSSFMRRTEFRARNKLGQFRETANSGEYDCVTLQRR